MAWSAISMVLTPSALHTRISISSASRGQLRLRLTPTRLTRISHNQVENDVFHGMRWVRGMELRVASLKRLRRAGIRVFSTPFCGRDGESLGIRARGRPTRSAASVMKPVEPGFYVGAKMAQINRKFFQYGKAYPNAR